ncbi:hypothetical protein VVD49_02155 [Uliginosibacterium sp. H3]|uniref:Uncharacterized protein n=1 Tax=Uliginosibacterium silvisoli TaxID=3114758 RepID=A0ABU6JXW7_9RHOO|nr:hypothetical protein [Uliginosibacterium sp. H3]
MGKTNRQWHEAHRMPRNASLEQRLQWHLAHAAHCSCRPMPASIVAEMKTRGIKTPSASPDPA